MHGNHSAPLIPSETKREVTPHSLPVRCFSRARGGDAEGQSGIETWHGDDARRGCQGRTAHDDGTPKPGAPTTAQVYVRGDAFS